MRYVPSEGTLSQLRVRLDFVSPTLDNPLPHFVRARMILRKEWREEFRLPSINQVEVESLPGGAGFCSGIGAWS